MRRLPNQPAVKIQREDRVMRFAVKDRINGWRTWVWALTANELAWVTVERSKLGNDGGKIAPRSSM